jgi:hypothetical protein
LTIDALFSELPGKAKALNIARRSINIRGLATLA